jgi:hypothetical protein
MRIFRSIFRPLLPLLSLLPLELVDGALSICGISVVVGLAGYISFGSGVLVATGDVGPCRPGERIPLGLNIRGGLNGAIFCWPGNLILLVPGGGLAGYMSYGSSTLGVVGEIGERGADMGADTFLGVGSSGKVARIGLVGLRGIAIPPGNSWSGG